MNNAPPYRAIVAATGTLVVGWALGYLMGGPSELSHVASAQATATGDRGAGDDTRREVVERFSSSNDPGFVSISDSSLAANGNVTAQFDTLIRRALRITDATDRLMRLREIARALQPSEIPDAVAKVKRLGNTERYQVLHALGSRWAEVAPAAAAEYAAKSGNDGYGWNQLLAGVVEKWAAIDQQAAVTWIQTQPDSRRTQLLQSMIQSVARQDPEAALKILQAQPESYQTGWLNGQVFEQWAQRDPAGAAKSAEGMKLGASRDRALQSVAVNWAAQDPAAAMKWAESFPDKANQNKLLRGIAMSWAEREPKAVIQWAATLTEASVRQEIVGRAFGQMAQTDAEGAEAQLRQIPAGQERDNLITRILSNYNSDPKAGLRFVELLPAGPMRTNETANLVMRIAATDPKTAAEMFKELPIGQLTYQVGQFAGGLANGNMDFAKEWVEQITDPQQKTQAFRAVAGVLARGEPKAAAEWLMEKQPSADLTWLLNQWVRNAPKDVLAWSKDLPDGDAKRSAEVSIVQQMAFTDVQQARAVFAKDLTKEAQVSCSGALAAQWANRDLGGARAWAESLPSGGARDNALGSIARTWAQQDIGATAQWLQRFEQGDSRDRAVTQFASVAIQKDPASAMAWVATIADPDLRGAQMEQLATRWLQADAAAAREWIGGSEHLSPSARRRVLEQRTTSHNYNYNYNYNYSYDSDY